MIVRGLFRLTAVAALLCTAACGAPARPDGASTTAASEPEPRDRSHDELCPEVARFMPVEMCEGYRLLAKAAVPGKGAFNAPKAMEVGKSIPITLAIAYTPAPTPSDLAAAPPSDDVSAASDAAAAASDSASAAPDAGLAASDAGSSPTAPTPDEVVERFPGETEHFTPIVGPRMTASLSGEGFDIAPAGPQPQDLTPGETISWTWKVTARDEGVHVLKVMTAVEAPGPDGENLKLNSTITQASITVSIGLVGRVWMVVTGLPQWLKALTAVVTALTALLAAIVALRRMFGKPKAKGDGRELPSGS
jgi:hypothetical protein